jgi:cell fate regulator YaaT (PSP1 superfamily)
MSCSSCGSGGCSPAGCKDNGHCSTGGCNKLNVYDWLGGMALPPNYKPFDIVEVRFKGSRKEYFRNSNQLEIFTGDLIVVDAESGYDIGHVSLKGELVKLQLKKNGIKEDSVDLPKILRIAKDTDTLKYKDVKAEEPIVLQRARTLALQMKLQMKLSDIEFRGDRKKVTFFYTAEDRVDFRELIKKYADEFKTRIEMRQIGYRQEAARLGGIGSCGRELCCSTWLTDFKIVNVGAARYQNLSLNPLKLQGQCGRLKCCLNFELDTYMESLSDFPKDTEKIRLETQIGPARSIKTDILKKIIWFAYEGGISTDWIPVHVKDVNEYIALNKQGIKPERLGEYDKVGEPEKMKTATEEFEGSLTRMENRGRNNNQKSRNNNRPNSQNRNPNNQVNSGQDKLENNPNKNPNAKPNRPPHRNNNNKPPQGNKPPIKGFQPPQPPKES